MSATIRVSKSTLKLLEDLRSKMKAKSIDEVIQKLIIERRSKILNETFGIDKGRISSFSEEDRAEDRN